MKDHHAVRDRYRLSTSQSGPDESTPFILCWGWQKCCACSYNGVSICAYLPYAMTAPKFQGIFDMCPFRVDQEG